MFDNMFFRFWEIELKGNVYRLKGDRKENVLAWFGVDDLAHSNAEVLIAQLP